MTNVVNNVQWQHVEIELSLEWSSRSISRSPNSARSSRRESSRNRGWFAAERLKARLDKTMTREAATATTRQVETAPCHCHDCRRKLTKVDYAALSSMPLQVEQERITNRLHLSNNDNIGSSVANT